METVGEGTGPGGGGRATSGERGGRAERLEKK